MLYTFYVIAGVMLLIGLAEHNIYITLGLLSRNPLKAGFAELDSHLRCRSLHSVLASS